MITHDKWNKILGTYTIIVGIIVSIESSFGLFANPPLWIGYGILILISIWFIFRKNDTENLENPENPIPGKLRVDLLRLPEPTTKLVGREAELAQLDEALKDPKMAIVATIAGGGVGKSALIWEWLQCLEPDYGGATRVFAWSFYSQDSHQKLNSTVAFFEAALPFFDYKLRVRSFKT
jgi:hypothetical protein